MLAHHEQAITRIADAYRNEPGVLAAIVGGSVAKGWAIEGSDVDYMLVLEQTALDQARQNEQLMTYRTDLTDYQGGYADGKLISLHFLEQVAEKGSEPARSAFLGGMVLFDHSARIPDLISRILVYPEAGVEERIRRFHSQLMIWRWFVGEAAKRQDPYLMARAAAEMSLFSMRVVLAVNRRLYPFHKWVGRMVEECQDKPDDFIGLVQHLSAHPSVESAQAVVDALHAWLPLGVDYREHCHHFLLDSEWNWMDHPAPIGDL